MSQLNIICLVPVRNEAWILDRFLHCASLWADYIIVVDQDSTDGSREIALKYSKVILIDNPSAEYNEVERQKLLINEARKLPGKRLLITLDADEMLTANYMMSPEWNRMLQAPEGAVFTFRWINIKPDFKTYWSPNIDFPWGFMDDGSSHIGSKMHSVRIPFPASSKVINLNEIKVLHYQYTDWKRMESKHRWYQCLERINHPSRSAIDIYRQYHHMYSIPEREIGYLEKEWFSGYEEKRIDMMNIKYDNEYWFNRKVLDILNMYGTRMFKKEAIWDIDWTAVATACVLRGDGIDRFTDPRTPFERGIHKWLKMTQQTRARLYNRIIETILKKTGW